MARALVGGSSAAVLVLEILAGRLLAPYVGVSLETFTGIIGIVLAGIAAGAWAGGVMADQQDPNKLIGIMLAAGGALTWIVLPILDALGPQFGNGGVAIVVLSLAALFLPAAVLSTVTPLVAKLTLGDLNDTGAVVGGLSAAGTIGALAGTFITGFVLVSALPTRLTVIILGLLLVVWGLVTHLMLAKTRPPLNSALLVLFAAAGALTAGQPCAYETGYFCGNVIVDEDNPAERSLILDGLRHAFVDLDDPTNLDIRYIRLFAQVSDSLPSGSLNSLHIGGGGFSFPRYVQEVRPGSTDLVLEIDPSLVTLGEEQLGLMQTDSFQIQVGDARLALGDIDDDIYDLIIGDAFGSASVPWHLTTEEFIGEIDRVLAPDGVYVMNVIDGDNFDFARAEVATLATIFEHVQIIIPPDGLPLRGPANVILVASPVELPDLQIAAEDGQLIIGDEAADFYAGASTLTDDFAPVDNLQGG